jgi:ADP-ribosylglycohydrolase
MSSRSQCCLFTRTEDTPGKAGGRKLGSPLADEDKRRRLALALEPAQGPELVATQGTHFCTGGGRRAALEPVARNWRGVREGPHVARRTALGCASRPFDSGSTTVQALSAAASAPVHKAEAARAAANWASQSNGALMRCAPIGIWASHAEEASMAARDDARLTHPHPVCQAASAAFVAAITTAVGGSDQEAMADGGRKGCAGAGSPVGAGSPGSRKARSWSGCAFHNAFRHLELAGQLKRRSSRRSAKGAIPTPTQRSAGRCSVLLRGAPLSRCAGAWPCWLAALYLRPAPASRGPLRGPCIEENLSASSRRLIPLTQVCLDVVC